MREDVKKDLQANFAKMDNQELMASRLVYIWNANDPFNKDNKETLELIQEEIRKRMK